MTVWSFRATYHAKMFDRATTLYSSHWVRSPRAARCRRMRSLGFPCGRPVQTKRGATPPAQMFCLAKADSGVWRGQRSSVCPHYRGPTIIKAHGDGPRRARPSRVRLVERNYAPLNASEVTARLRSKRHKRDDEQSEDSNVNACTVEIIDEGRPVRFPNCRPHSFVVCPRLIAHWLYVAILDADLQCPQWASLGRSNDFCD